MEKAVPLVNLVVVSTLTFIVPVTHQVRVPTFLSLGRKIGRKVTGSQASLVRHTAHTAHNKAKWGSLL
jgi:hypothetical protein